MEWDCHICNRCQTTFATDRELPTPEEGHLDLEGCQTAVNVGSVLLREKQESGKKIKRVGESGQRIARKVGKRADFIGKNIQIGQKRVANVRRPRNMLKKTKIQVASRRQNTWNHRHIIIDWQWLDKALQREM
jgi:hypothetical protein